MNNKAFLGVGIIGTVLTALCCFTPALVIVLGAIGLSALTGYLDYVLLPTLAVFIIILAYAVYKAIAGKGNRRLN